MRDVRMRGFAERSDVEDVEALLARLTRPLAAEDVPLLACVGRVLARDVVSPVDVPGFRRAAMDGYAVRGEETFGASLYSPISLRLLGESLPGRPYDGTVEGGEAVRIMTGAPLPPGADAVVPAESCREEGRDEPVVRVSDAVAPQKNVGAVGEDLRRDDLVLRRGRRLRPQDGGLLSSMGLARVACITRPRVDLVSTGDELLAPGSRPEGSKIVDSNSVVLTSLVARDGGQVMTSRLLPDRPEMIREAMEKSTGHVLLISGGSSVGQEDHAPRLLAELGRLDFHGVTMRPSGPAGGGRLGERLVFLLPGNPVSCLCAYEFFAGPTLRHLGGRSRRWPHRRYQAPLGRKIVSHVGRTDYVRVALEEGKVMPLATAGASVLSSTVRAAGAVIIPRELEGLAEGSEVEVLLYDEESPELGV